jgi:hypothetical protein
MIIRWSGAMTTTPKADRINTDWQIQAETALVAGLTYVAATIAAATVAAAGDRIMVIGAASVCFGALGAVVGIALAAVGRILVELDIVGRVLLELTDGRAFARLSEGDTNATANLHSGVAATRISRNPALARDRGAMDHRARDAA